MQLAVWPITNNCGKEAGQVTKQRDFTELVTWAVMTNVSYWCMVTSCDQPFDSLWLTFCFEQTLFKFLKQEFY